MIKIEYTIKFPDGSDPQSFFPTDIRNQLAESKSLALNELGAIFDRLYDPSTNTVTMIYLWQDQATVDLFYERAMAILDYPVAVAHMIQLIEDAGGTYTRVQTEI